MSNGKLDDALNGCIISFDSRVFLTDLLQEYKLSYKVVEETLKEHLKLQEGKGTKYDKRYLVHGEEKDCNKEIYTVVQGEIKLQEWLQKFKNVEFSLYSVEVDGGAKTPAQLFKPIQECALKLNSLAARANIVKTNTFASANGNASVSANNISINTAKAIKTENIQSKTGSEPTTSSGAKIATTNTKKVSPETKKKSPADKKTTQKSTDKKTGGISKLFSPTVKKGAATAATAKPATTKKMQDFLKKNTPDDNAHTKLKIKPDTKAEPNKSLQLFEEEDSEHEAVEPESSDEEEKLEALKRDIISSDHEEEIAPSSSNVKRRRVLSSEDEEEKPQAKHEKTEQIQKPTHSVTYIDEDGFVVTVKSKNPNSSCKTKTTEEKPKTKSPLKMPEKPLTAKPKQGNIMNFFKKK